MIVNARCFLKYTPLQLLENLRGYIDLQLDDKTLSVKWQDIVVSRYAWDLHREYPQTPLLSKHLISAHGVDGGIGAQSTVKLLESVYLSVYAAYEHLVENPTALMETLMKRIYQISTNNLYSQLSVHLSEYVSGLDILDILQILDDPKIKEAKKNVEASQEGINKLYGVFKDVFKSPELKYSPIARACNIGVIKTDQTLQVLGVRGYLTDTGSQIFPEPIMRGYADGLRKIVDFAMESRSASKALATSEASLQLAEYFSRLVQHITMGAVQRLHRGDCGNPRHLPWKVKDRVVLGGLLQTECDLIDLEGKYYLHESGQYRVVKTTDRHLIGQTIMLRSPLVGCMHEDPAGICSTCYGEGATSISLDTNIGMHSAVQMMEQLVQKVISVKHYDGSASILGIHLDASKRTYLWAPDNSNAYYINKSAIKQAGLKMIVTPAQMRGISDILHADDVEKLNVERLSLFSTITFSSVDEDGLISNSEIEVELNGRLPSLTHEALKYIKVQHYTLDNHGNFVIDLKKWDWTQPILNLPMKHYNMGDLRVAVESFLTGEVKFKSDSADDEEVNRSHQKDQQDDDMVDVPVHQLLTKFHTLISAKLRVPVAALEVILLSHLVANGKHYRIPKGTERGEKAKLTDLYRNRSMGALMAWEEHRTTFTSPRQFLREAKDRPDHPLDVAIKPKEVVANGDQGDFFRYKCNWYCCAGKT